MFKFYLAGPMRNIPKFNYPLFDEVARILRVRGWNIISPAELDDPADRELALQNETGDLTKSLETWGTYLSRDIKIVIDEVDGIVFLPNWHTSRGAKLEAFAALAAGKTKFYVYNDGMAWTYSVEEVRAVLVENMP